MMHRSKRLGLRLALVGFLVTLARPGRTDGTYNTYVNTPWYTVVSTPPTSDPGANHQYVLTAVPTPVDEETGLPLTHFAGFSLSVRGDNRALEKDGLFIACRVHELPLGTTLPAGSPTAPRAGLGPYFVFQKPAGVLQLPTFFFPKPYVVKPGNGLFLLAQIKYEGDSPTIGPVTCAATIYWEE